MKESQKHPDRNPSLPIGDMLGRLAWGEILGWK